MAGDLAVVRRIMVVALWLQAALEEVGGEGRRLSLHPNESTRQATFASSSAVARATLGIDALALALAIRCLSHATPSGVEKCGKKEATLVATNRMEMLQQQTLLDLDDTALDND